MEAKKPVSSRLIKQEGKKLVRQTIVFIGAAIVLILLFIFVVLPLFIRFVNSVLGTNPIAEDETVFLQSPVISAPVEATKSAQLKITGYSTPEHQVVLVLNGQEHARTSVAGDGAFSSEIKLREGENSLTSYSIDKKDNESKTGQTFTIILDTEIPNLEIEKPSEGEKIDSRDAVVTVEGKAEGASRVFINDRVVFPESSGAFRTQHSLTEGKNEIKVKAVDEAGNENEQIITVEYVR